MQKILTLIIASAAFALPLAASADVVAPAPTELHAIVPCATCAIGITSASAIQSPAGYGAESNVFDPTDGNAILRHLPELFVLNAMFANYGSGILTPGPASLGNILELYRIFYM